MVVFQWYENPGPNEWQCICEKCGLPTGEGTIWNGRHKIGKYHKSTYIFLIHALFVSKCTLLVSTNTALVYVYHSRSTMTEIDINIQDGGQNHENILILICTYNVRHISSISNIRTRKHFMYATKGLSPQNSTYMEPVVIQNARQKWKYHSYSSRCCCGGHFEFWSVIIFQIVVDIIYLVLRRPFWIIKSLCTCFWTG